MENENELNNNLNSENVGTQSYNSPSKFQVISDSYSKNNFNNYSNNSSRKSKSNGGFLKSVFVPFVSGILGCSLVIGTCFGVPAIKEKLIGTESSVQTSNNSSTSGTVSQVNLTNYSDTAVYAANKILPSIVGIEIQYTVTSSFFMFGGPSTSTATASGSGIIISENGYILTNNHVVDTSSSSSSYSYYDLSEATSVKVKLFGDETAYNATIVGKDSKTDLAVLKIEAEGLTAAEFADSSKVKIGEFAMAIGNPLGLGSSITCGVVSAVDREVSSDDGTTYTCIQTDAAINSGNSGGALVNSEGKVIGVNTLKLSGTGVEGIGFAIPINSTLDVTDDLITHNKVLRPYIGLTTVDLTEDLAKSKNLVVGVYVKYVDDFSAGEKAGIKPGDVIIKADGKEVKTNKELNKIRDTHKIGEEMTVTVYRNGAEKDLTVTLQEAP